jgi:hypothetical protein
MALQDGVEEARQQKPERADQQRHGDRRWRACDRPSSRRADHRAARHFALHYAVLRRFRILP